MQKSKQQKHILSTELFDGKTIPPFIKDHRLFNSPVQIQKIFPSIGLANFNEGVKIQKSITEIRKETGYVINLLTVMHANMMQAVAMLETNIGKFQFLGTRETREAKRPYIEKLNYWCNIAKEVVKNCDPQNKEMIQFGIELNNGLVELKLLNNITHDGTQSGKKIYGKGANLFSTYNRLRTALLEIDSFYDRS